MKTHTDWVKEKIKTERYLPVQGMLLIKEIFPPGSAVAVPIDEQKKLDGDFDGDPILLIADHEALYQKVREDDQNNPPMPLKMPKSYTPAIDANGEYQFDRSEHIIATKQNITENFSSLQNLYLAMPVADRSEFVDFVAHSFVRAKEMAEELKMALPIAESTLFGTLSSSTDTKEKDQALSRLIQQGLQAGTDAYKSQQAIPLYSNAAKLLQGCFRSYRKFQQSYIDTWVPESLPYHKGTLRKIKEGRFNEDEARFMHKKLENNPNLAAGIMRTTLQAWLNQQPQ